MRIVIANLKLLCQCVFQWWVVTALAVLSVVLCLFPDLVNAKMVLAAVVLAPLVVGMVVGMMQDALTRRVGVFCLPRPHGERRRLALVLGLLAASGAMLVFIGYADRFDIPAHRGVLVVGSVFSASLLLCLLGAAAPFLAGLLLLGLPSILSVFIALFAPSWPNVSTLLEGAIIYHPGAVMAVAVIGVVLTWFWLARPVNDLRHHRTRPSTKRTARQRFFAKAVDKAERKDAVQPWISEVLLERMGRSLHTGTAKHVWSSLYLWLHPRGGGRLELIGGVLLGVISGVSCWYASSVFLLILVIAMWSTGHRWPMHSRLMTAGGRRERFLNTMAQLAVSGGVFTLSVVLSFLTADALQDYLREPAARALAIELSYVPLGLGGMLLVLTFVPLACLVDMVLADRFKMGWTALWASAIVLSGMAELVSFNVPLVWGALALVLAWALCTASVCHITRRADLCWTARSEPTSSASWQAICEAAAGKQHRGVR